MLIVVVLKPFLKILPDLPNSFSSILIHLFNCIFQSKFTTPPQHNSSNLHDIKPRREYIIKKISHRIYLINQIPTMGEPETSKSLVVITSLVDKIGDRIGKETLPIILMVTSNLMWPFWFYYVSSHNVPVWEIIMARGAAISLSHLPILWMLGMASDFRTWFDLKYSLIRNTIVLLHQVLYSQTHYYLPFPITNAISLTGPLFAFVIDYYLYGVEVNKKQTIGIIAGVLGVLLACNSQYILLLIDDEYVPKTKFQHYKTESIALKTLVAFIGILFNVGWAYAMVIQKKIKHVAGIKISLFLGVEMLFSSALAYLLGLFKPSGVFMESFFYSGLGMGLCQILFISALNMSKKTGLLTLLMCLYIVPSYVISFFRYDEPLNPICLSGIGLMLYGLYQAIFKKDQ